MFTLDQIIQIRNSFKTVIKRKKENRLREIREKAVGNADLLETACASLAARGIRVERASDGKEALRLLEAELQGAGLVVKSKSNVAKEMGLPKALEDKGMEVIETDIGDRILQIMGEKPSHPTGPATHLSAKEISIALTKHFGRSVGSSPEEIVEEIRSEIVEYIGRANVAITGANAIAAQEGAVVILHNEGNVSEIIQRTGKLVVLTGQDKIYPALQDAIAMVKTVTSNATGQAMPSFVNIISGTSKTADVEKKLIQGIHNPREVVVIIVDGGRTKMAGGEFKEMLYCIGCGSCLVYCPAYNTAGDSFGIDGSLAGRGLIFSYAKNDNKAAAGNARQCLTCYHCFVECPVDINIPKMIWNMRKAEGVSNLYSMLYSRVLFFKRLLRLKLHQILNFIKKNN